MDKHGERDHRRDPAGSRPLVEHASRYGPSRARLQLGVAALYAAVEIEPLTVAQFVAVWRRAVEPEIVEPGVDPPVVPSRCAPHIMPMSPPE
jgi:hypothetical protein